MVLQIIDIPENILKLKQDIDIELHGEDEPWINNDSSVRTLPLPFNCSYVSQTVSAQ